MSAAGCAEDIIAHARISVPDIDICICSYRRMSIVDTLAGLACQSGIEGLKIRIVVADNTVDGESRERILATAGRYRLWVDYLHAPANNISIARNACLDAAKAAWVAFLDDDEIPFPRWLASLWSEAQSGGWDAVLGPVSGIYADDAPEWLKRGEFHSTKPVWVKGAIRTAYAGNVLVRREAIERAGLRFRLDFGRSGGEDDDFFYRLSDAGGQIGFTPAAEAYEFVEPGRASLSWLMRRHFRAGQTHGTRLLATRTRVLALPLAAAKALLCGVGAIASYDAVKRARCMVRAALHCGVVARLAGMRVIAMY